METFATRFKEARHATGLSQDNAAPVVGKSVRAIRYWESGESVPETAVQNAAINALKAYKHEKGILE